MPLAERRANVVWEGTLTEGKGEITSVGSGAFGNLPVTWAARTERSDGKTSPEELIAAAQASCYAMALSVVLGERGTPPESLNVSAVCAFDEVGGAPKVTTVDLSVRGKVPGLDEAGFQEAAQVGEQLCPVANALRNNVDIRLTAALEAD
jgi:osmotically inducible protein OsmC